MCFSELGSSRFATTDFVFGVLQSVLCHLIEPLKNIDFYRPALSTADVVENTVDSLLSIVSCDGRLGIDQELCVRFECICWSPQDKKEEFRHLL